MEAILDIEIHISFLWKIEKNDILVIVPTMQKLEGTMQVAPFSQLAG